MTECSFNKGDFARLSEYPSIRDNDSTTLTLNEPNIERTRLRKSICSIEKDVDVSDWWKHAQCRSKFIFNACDTASRATDTLVSSIAEI